MVAVTIWNEYRHEREEDPANHVIDAVLWTTDPSLAARDSAYEPARTGEPVSVDL